MEQFKPGTAVLRPKTTRRDIAIIAGGTLASVTAAFIVAFLLGSSAGCRFGLGGAVQDMGPGSDNAALKLTGLDARGADVAGLDASQEERNEATQGATTITGEGATVYNVQAVGGGAVLLIVGLLALVFMLRRKTASANELLAETTEALDRVVHAIRKARGSDEGKRIAEDIHKIGCARHPTRGHVHDRAESVIRDRLALIKVASQ